MYEDGIELSLRSWWSKTYNRPLKDPLLDTYTIYELLYEYKNRVERIRASELDIELEADKIEDAAVEETLDWIEEEERKEKETVLRLQKEKDDQWMVDQLKKENGEDFGKDIDLNFGE
jgi:hypothetical protein